LIASNRPSRVAVDLGGDLGRVRVETIDLPSKVRVQSPELTSVVLVTIERVSRKIPDVGLKALISGRPRNPVSPR
jgi:hypothetical protein